MYYLLLLSRVTDTDASSISIARTASSASKACDMGSTTDAQQIVDELKRNVLLVAELVSQVKLADASG